jgi:hypothetical protein
MLSSTSSFQLLAFSFIPPLLKLPSQREKLKAGSRRLSLAYRGLAADSAAFALLPPVCPLNVRVGANSPSL